METFHKTTAEKNEIFISISSYFIVSFKFKFKLLKKQDQGSKAPSAVLSNCFPSAFTLFKHICTACTIE